MAILNPNFAEPGAYTGLAADWTLTASTALEAVAGFGTNPEVAVEDFERWHAFVSTFDEVPQVRAFFVDATLGYESFDTGWSNAPYQRVFSEAQLEWAKLSPANTEAFESGWANAPFVFDWSAVSSSAALFDGESSEDFEEQWRDNQNFVRNWQQLASVPAQFDAGASGTESFEGLWSTQAAR
ncbi:MAG: hypothetical protein ACM3ZE_14425 [Myxococcales bacterium]